MFRIMLHFVLRYNVVLIVVVYYIILQVLVC